MDKHNDFLRELSKIVLLTSLSTNHEVRNHCIRHLTILLKTLGGSGTFDVFKGPSLFGWEGGGFLFSLGIEVCSRGDNLLW